MQGAGNDETPGVIESTRVGGRAVVTGVAGFIGSHLVEALLARGGQVVAVDRRPVHDGPGRLVNAVRDAGHPKLRVLRVELAKDDLDEMLGGADTVFHLAAVPGVRGSWGQRFGDYAASNVVGTHRLLRSCERAGVRRLVLASSSSVYGHASGPSREDGPTAPMSPYGVTKLAAEQLCLAHVRRADTGLSVAVLRYFTVYGPRQRPDMAISRVLRSALTGTPFELYGDGRQRRELTYVDDVVTATLAAASAPLTAAVVNVAGGCSVSMLEVLEMARQVTGRAVTVIATDPRPGDVESTEADLTLARTLLGYQPSVDLREGMTRHATWLTDASSAFLPVVELGAAR